MLEQFDSTVHAVSSVARLARATTVDRASLGLLAPKLPTVPTVDRASLGLVAPTVPTGVAAEGDSRTTQLKLIVPDSEESAAILRWLRVRTPTYRQAAYACHVIAALHAVAMLVEYEAHTDPSRALTRIELWSGFLFAVLGFVLHCWGDDGSPT